MKEYVIYIRYSSGKPFFTSIYSDFYSARNFIECRVKLDEERLRPYYVDNDFFENKYSLCENLTYYCLKEREVSDWSKYSKEKSVSEENKKIVFFSDYLNS